LPNTLSLRVKGLITNPNTLNPNVADGALAYADNIVVDKDNLAESRRGFSKYGQYLNFGDGNYDGTIENLFNYQDKLIVHYANKLALDPETNDEWQDYSGTFASPDINFRSRSIESNRNFYVTTNDGIYKLDGVDSQFETSGMIRALDGDGIVTGSSGWFETGKAVAYRLVWGKTDKNSNLILGSPSSRLVIGNASGGNRVTELTYLIPQGITTDNFYQIYRSNLSESLTDEPNDELQLVLEGKPASGDITAGFFTVMDELPSSLRGATLYTSPSQQGIANANEVPPYAKDMCVFKNHVFYGNTKTKHRFGLKVLGVGSSGFDIGDTLTINSIVFTGASGEVSANREFKVFDSASPAQDIEDTCLSLIRVLNKNASSTGVYAYYLSGFDDIPGQLLLEKVDFDDQEFSVQSSQGSAFIPELPVSGTTSDNVSENEERVNRVYISKPLQPEAVPLFSFIDIGSSNQAIRRIIALRDSVFVFKDDGIFKITGESTFNFRATLFDSTVKLLAPESVQTFNNTVFAMTLQGVVSISDSGISVVSRQIEQELLKLIQYPEFNRTTFAVSYESERKYILFCISSENQKFPTQAYVYNSFTNAWTRWTYTATCGVINNQDDKLYLGGKIISYSASWVYKERKTFTLDDYVDDDWGVQIVSKISPTQIVVNRTQDLVLGYWIRQFLANQGTYVLGKIIDIDYDTNTVTLENSGDGNWSSDPVDQSTIYKPIVCRLKWVANHAGNPGILKQFREATLFFRQDTASTLNLGYETNFQPGYEFTQAVTVNAGLWGTFDWGTLPFGGLDDTFAQPVRIGIPRNKQRCMWISFSVEGSNAFSSFSVAGISTTFEVDSERFSFKPGR